MFCFSLLIFTPFRVFHSSVSQWFFTRVLSDRRSFPVYRTLLSILADHNNGVVWIVSSRPLISKSSSHYTIPLVTVPRASITNGINVTFMFQSFFQFSGQVFLFAFFQFYYVVSRNSKVHNSASSLFFVDYYKVWSSVRD